MIKPTATKFRQHTGNYFDAVENGERIIVSRYGKPVAEVWPINRSQAPSWKESGPRLVVDNVSLSQAILEERSEQRIWDYFLALTPSNGMLSYLSPLIFARYHHRKNSG